MTRVLNNYRLKPDEKQTVIKPVDIKQETVWPLLTFTGGSIESITAQITGHAPKTCITGTGTVTKVTVVTFTTVTAGRADSAGTDWKERNIITSINSWSERQHIFVNDVTGSLTYSWCHCDHLHAKMFQKSLVRQTVFLFYKVNSKYFQKYVCYVWSGREFELCLIICQNSESQYK